MSSPADNPELLTNYGPWNLDAFLTSDDRPSTVLALVSVESNSRTDEARELTNDVVHRVWNAATSIPGCVGHRLSWDQVLFLLAEAEAKGAHGVLASVPARAPTHTIHCWFTSAGTTLTERRAAIRELEDQRERSLPHRS